MYSEYYSKCSSDELLEIKNNIAQEQCPERYNCLINEISKRQGHNNILPTTHNENITSNKSKPVDILNDKPFKGEYSCSLKRLIVVNLIGFFSGDIISLMAQNSSSATSFEFGQFVFFELLILFCMVASLYTGKSISMFGIVDIKKNYIYVTFSQILSSYLFYLGLFIGIEQFAS